MIVYDLICDTEHRFEAWFASADEFDRQCGTELLACPVCGSGSVRRVPSAVRTTRHGRDEPTPAAPAVPSAESGPATRLHELALQVVRELVSRSENVGRRFPEEARRIHYGEAPARSIRGQASAEEAEALREEGIEVLHLPVPPAEEVH